MEKISVSRVNLLKSPWLGTAFAALLLIMPMHSLYQWFNQLEHENYQQELQHRSWASHQNVLSTVENMVIQLQALKAHFELSEQVSRQDFNHLSAAHLSQQLEFASFQWIPAITSAEISQYEQSAHKDGIFDFAIRSQTVADTIADNDTVSAGTNSPQSLLYPIYFSTSAQMDELLLGTDLGRIPALASALHKASSTDNPTLASQIIVEEDNHPRQELRLFLAVRKVADRRQHNNTILGFVSVRFYLDNLIDMLLGHQLQSRAALALVIRNLTQANQPVLYHSASLPQLHHSPVDSSFKLQHRVADNLFEFSYIDQRTSSRLWFDASVLWFVTLLTLALVILTFVYFFLHRLEQQRQMLEDSSRSLEQAEMNYDKLFHNVIEGLYRADIHGNLLSVNTPLAKALGYRSPEAMMATVNNIASDLYCHPEQYQDFCQQLLEDKQVKHFEWSATSLDNQQIWFSEHAVLVDESVSPPQYEASLNIITKRKHSEQRLSYQANHDALTGCLNRASFSQQLADHLHTLAPTQPKGMIIFLDIDRFKKINDVHGHRNGDELLVTISQRLKLHLRPQDLVARFGGDEFIVYFANIHTVAMAETLAQRLQEQIQQPVNLPGISKICCSASIGICLIEAQQYNVEQLLQNADIAMYEVKRHGRAAQKVFTPDLDKQNNYLKQIEQELKKALYRDEFSLNYQPIINIETGQIKGFEALLRWHNQQLGQVSPADFIPVMEETGAISRIGPWLFETAISQFAEIRQGLTDPSIYLNINISPQQLVDDRLLPSLSQTLQRYGLSEKVIHIEITESAIHHYEDQVIEHLEAFKQQGFNIYIDDFGTGHSTLQRLMRYPINGLKIDRSFIQPLGQDRTHRLIVQSLIQMARLLEMPFVAEGVETQEQLAILKEMKCPSAQGYLFSRPLTFTDTISYINQLGTNPHRAQLHLING